METVAGQKPAAFTQLERCNAIAGIALNAEQIDASALEDFITRYVAGRQDSGGTWGVTFNFTSEVETQLTAMISAYNTGKTNGLSTWFEVAIPNFDSFYFAGMPIEFGRLTRRDFSLWLSPLRKFLCLRLRRMVF